MSQKQNEVLDDDEQHWIKIAGQVENPDVAGGIVKFLDCYPSLRARHGGLYLVACEVIHRKRMQELAESLKNRASRRFTRWAGQATEVLYRCGRLIFRAGIQFLIYLFNKSRNEYRRYTVVYPASKPMQKSTERKWKSCPTCSSPVGTRQERCDECGCLINSMPRNIARA
jgi:hypothetical protein